MVFKARDFVTFNFIAKIKEDDKVFDSNIEKVAEDNKIKRNGVKYEPLLNVIGEGWLLKPVDDCFLTAELDKTMIIAIPPKDAFGERDPSKVRVVSLSALREVLKVNPKVGQRIQYGGRTAVIRTINSGRVTIDSNQMLAGKTLVYEVTIKSLIERKEDQVKALIHRRFPSVDVDKFVLFFNDNTLLVEMPTEVLNLDGLQPAKRGVFQDVTKFFSDIAKVNFLESYEVGPKVNPSEPKVGPVIPIEKKPAESQPASQPVEPKK